MTINELTRAEIRRPAQKRSRARFEAILDGAERLLDALPPSAISIHAIAAEVEISPPSIYHFFPEPQLIFSALAERQGIAPEQRHFIEGVPLMNICNFAHDHQIDVIVMGTVQHGGLNKLLGTTAESLLHHAPCSMWAIKPSRG